MTYLVMECHPGYAVVLDQTGRFLKVANLNYQVGETVSFVIECTAEEEPITIKSLRRRRMLLSAASLAACFFLAVLGTWHVCLTPYGAVRIQINPDLKLTVNRLDYVISADGLNDDGLRLLDGYQFRGQKLEQASGELADRAMEMGYLKEGGQIFLTLESSHENWIAKTEDRLLTELENHLNDTVSVTASAASEAPASAEPLPTGSLSDVPVPPSAPDDTPLSGISKFQETDEEDDDSEDEGNEDALDEDDEDDSEDTSEGKDDDREDAADRQDDDSERDTDNNDLDEHSPRLDTDDDAEHTDDHNDNDKDEHDSDDSSDKDSNEHDTDDSSDDDGNEHDTDDSSDDDGDEHDSNDSSDDDSNDNDDD
mgnify:CR=1 FL=1